MVATTYTQLYAPYCIAILQVILFVFSSVNPFTSKDAIWYLGVKIHLEVNLSIYYKFCYVFTI